MLHVVFVIPFATANTQRFARAVAALPDVRLSVVSQDPAQRFPAPFRERLAGFEQVADAMQVDDLCGGVERLAAQVGPVARLLGVLEPLQEPLAQARERLRIRGMDHGAAQNFRDKARMKDLFGAHAIPCARHRLCGSVDEALAFARQVGFPLVGKPPAGAGAKATQRCNDERELQQFLAQIRPARGREVLLEEFVVGREFSFDSVTLHGKHVLHNICCYYPTPLEVVENPWIQWCIVLPRELDDPAFGEIHRTGPRALAALGMWTGISHMEWFRRRDGSIAISEVAARPPGAQIVPLIGYVLDCDMFDALARLWVFEQFPERPRRYAAACAFLRGQLPGSRADAGADKVARAKSRIVALHGVEAMQQKVGKLIVDLKLPEVGAAPVDSYEGDGHVIVRHPDTAVVTQAVQEIVRTVRVELG
ncbi:MAG: ATP-grasp domain-containing protein [Planctomycetes bacterium]|nr:ATP-grasp domain-containing protein [Planctomycetota bacterium]